MRINRISTLGIIYAVCTGILVCSFFTVGVLKSREYSEMVASQRTVSLEVKNRRGKLYDRNMIPMVEKSAVGIKADGTYAPETDGADMIIPVRYGDDSACHLIGYTDPEGNGICGLEKTFDVYMSTPIYEKVNVIKTADGNIIDSAGFKHLTSAEEGDSVVLTIDSHIQKICSETLKQSNVTGAAVVMDVSSFDVLAMASSPVYNQKDISAYMDSGEGEFVNRCVSSYNAGSIFKIVTLCAAIEERSLLPFYVCTGKWEFGSNEFGCHKADGHGLINPLYALARSCNCAFYTMGSSMGAKKIVAKAAGFGFGDNVVCCSGFDESGGNLPRKARYASIDCVNYAIGQGEILLTPLQVANMVSVIANRGYAKKVNVAQRVVDYKGSTKRVLREVGKRKVVSEKAAEFTGEAMRLAVTEGTASALRDNPAKIAGKTGTAETGWTKDGENMVHGWFCGFFPYDNPKYAMAVLVENGGSGSLSAVPVFGQIAEEIIKFYPIQ